MRGLPGLQVAVLRLGLALRAAGDGSEVPGFLFSPACPPAAVPSLLEWFGCVRETP